MHCRRVTTICLIILLNLLGLLLANDTDANSLENHAQAVTESVHMNEPGQPQLPEQSVVTIAAEVSHPVVKISPTTQATLSTNLSHTTRQYTPAVTVLQTTNSTVSTPAFQTTKEVNISTTSPSNISSTPSNSTQSDLTTFYDTWTPSPLRSVVTTPTKSHTSEYRTWQTTTYSSQSMPAKSSLSSTAATSTPFGSTTTSGSENHSTVNVAGSTAESTTASSEGEGTTKTVSVESTTRHLTTIYSRATLPITTKKHPPPVSTTTAILSTTRSTPLHELTTTSVPTSNSEEYLSTLTPSLVTTTPTEGTTPETTSHSTRHSAIPTLGTTSSPASTTTQEAVSTTSTTLQGTRTSTAQISTLITTTHPSLPTTPTMSSTKNPAVLTTPTTSVHMSTLKSTLTTMATLVHTATATPVHTSTATARTTSYGSSTTNHIQTETPITSVSPSITKDRKPPTAKPFPPSTPAAPHLTSFQTLSTIEPVTANASYRLPAYVQIRLQTTWTLFCPDDLFILQSVTEYSRAVLKLSTNHRVSANYLNVQDKCRDIRVDRTKRSDSGPIPVDFYVAINESYYENSTRKVGADLVSDTSKLQQDLAFEITSAYVLVAEKHTTPVPQHSDDRQGVVLGSTLTICALIFSILMTAIGLKLYRKSRTVGMDRYYFDGKQLQDALSESHQMGGVSPRGHSTRGLPTPTYREYFIESINRGYVIDEEDVFSEEDVEETLPSHVLSDSALAKFYSYTEAITEEFECLPGHNLISADARKRLTIHMGAKPYLPVHRSPDKTRVPIATVSPTHIKQDCVLDASFIRGYDSGHCSYIAAKVSGDDSSDAFWRTVWDQQSRTIICLCSPEEVGKVCPQYWPTKEGGQGAHLHGNLLVTMKGGASGEHYSTSSLLVRNVEKTLCRPVTHYWFSQWTEGHVPSSPHALMTMLLEIHNAHQESYGPVLVHCSDGVGRSGMVIATHINMQHLEDTHTIDVPKTVSSIRQDRGQAVLNADQYAYIYKTLYEFSKFLSINPGKETSDTESALENADTTSNASYQDRSSLKKNSSRSSSYLEDLSLSMKRRLALKFPTLGISLSKQTECSRNRNSVVELASPSTSPLDIDKGVFPQSTSSDDRDRDTSSSSLQSSVGHPDSSIQSDVSFSSLDDSKDQHSEGRTLFPVEETVARDDSSIAIPRPHSISLSGNMMNKGSRNTQRAMGDLSLQNGGFCNSSVIIDIPTSQLESTTGVLRLDHSRGRSATFQSGTMIDGSAGANGSVVFNIGLCGGQQDLDKGSPLSSCHIRQTSYPTDLNPFIPSLPSSSLPTNSRIAYQSSTCHPAKSSLSYRSVPVASPTSSSIPDQPGMTRDVSYPQNLNPFDVLVENRVTSTQRCRSVSASDNPFVLVPPHEPVAFVRQGTYPKGANPFEDISGTGQPKAHSEQLSMDEKMPLSTIHLKSSRTKTTAEARNIANGCSPGLDDWMDLAEESFT